MGTTRQDKRARLQLKGDPSLYPWPFYGPGEVLRKHRGILFPYTPVINANISTAYSNNQLTHTNYQQCAWSHTSSPDVTVQCMFAPQTPEEAAYLAGVLHFVKVVSKGHFGKNDPDSGTPPPVLEFSAHGVTNFHKIPVLVNNFSLIYDGDVDYIEVECTVSHRYGEVAEDSTLVPIKEVVHVPSQMSLAVSMHVQYNAAKQQEFSLQKFASGQLYSRGMM